jgi:hypothetical protein
MADTSEILLHQLLAAPLAALVRAEAMSALSFLDFITKVGFVPPTSGGPASEASLGTLRMISFKYQRQQAHGGQTLPMTLELPLLSLIPLPVLNIKDSQVTFGVAMTNIRHAATPIQSAQAKSAALPEIEMTVALPHGSAAQALHTPVMQVQMTVARGDFPGGIINLLQVINTHTKLSSP